MDINAAIAVASFVLAALGLAISIRTSHSSVQKDVIDALRVRIGLLEREVERWKLRYRALCDWVREQGLMPPGLWPDE